MSGTRWRFGVYFAVLSAAVVCFCLQPAGVVTAEDKGSNSSASSDAAAADQETTTDKAASTKSKKDAKSAKKKSNKKSSTKKTRGKSADPSTDGGTSGQSSSGGSTGSGLIGGSNGRSGVGSNGPGGSTPNPGNGDGGNPGGAGGAPQGGAGFGADPKELVRVMATQDKHTDDLLKQEGVVGTATGVANDGKVFIKVYTTGAGKPVIPEKLDGVPVKSVLAGIIRPFSGSSGQSKYDPQVRATRPIPIGVSAFNERSPECGGSSCFAGTLGCRLKAKDGSGYFALSNNHVFANENEATIGNTIVQPSPGDNNCNCAAGDIFATLYKFKPIDFADGSTNVMDAAVASTTRDKLSNRTLPDGYGSPRAQTIKSATVGTRVQKYGRTTGYTKGTVTAVNVTITVGYDAGPAKFVRQVEFKGSNGNIFGDHGDSGSLIVTEDRFPIALLFAGDDITHVVFGNPIQDVLNYFNMEFEENDDSDVTPPGKIGSSSPN